MQVYFGTFLLAFSTLAFEVVLTRLLSVVTWYHLAFFAISTAMLGMTAGAVTVYLRPAWFTPSKIPRALGTSCLLYGFCVPVTLFILCKTDLTVSLDFTGMSHLFIMAVACSLPFYFFGVAITVILTKLTQPVGKLYASDLLGASMGALFVLGGLEIMDAPSLIVFSGALGAASGLLFTAGKTSDNFRRICLYGTVVLLAYGFLSVQGTLRIRPEVIKGQRFHPASFVLDRWNSHSNVIVFKSVYQKANLWGPSPLTPKFMTWQHTMKIDGDAGTTVRRYSSPDDLEHLRYDVTNLVYYLRPEGNACIIGVGGGKDIHSALLFGKERVVGIDVNPIFIDLQKTFFRNFSHIGDQKGVVLIADEARSRLSRIKERFSSIQMALIDTWAATGAGAFSLSENGLYTVEAWKIFLNRLSTDGLFTVSRWYNPQDLSEAGRTLSLTVAALLSMGKTSPADHIAMVTSGRVATLLVSNSPFSVADLQKIQEVCRQKGFNLVLMPGKESTSALLNRIVHSRSMKELNSAIIHSDLDLTPSTDANPFFFNQLRLKNLFKAFTEAAGVIRGNSIATVVLLALIVCLTVLVLATVIIPLIIAPRHVNQERKQSHGFWFGALYFSLIGAGFMLVEIALLQRFSIFLGHPVYSLGVLLFSMILFTGIGSFISEYLPLTRRPWVLSYPFLAVFVILGIRMISPPVMNSLQTAGMPGRILASVCLIGPLGIVLGFFFPTGMKVIEKSLGAQSPWFWALNGIMGVFCSALAVFISIYVSIYFNLYLAAGCYLLTTICLFTLNKKSALSS